MNIFPSQQNSANGRTARRANWKQNLQTAVTPEAASETIRARFEIVAAKFISTGAVSVKENATYIQVGSRYYVVYQIKGAFKCECSDDEKYGVCAHRLAAEKFAAEAAESAKQSAIVEARATVERILSSPHIAAVEAVFEYADGNCRYYSATTNETGFPHNYRVRVEDSFETGERITTAKCNCAASAKNKACRHIYPVARIDAANAKREIYPMDLANYGAYRNYRRAA